jgi:uracil-DNA glycosylase family 4
MEPKLPFARCDECPLKDEGNAVAGFGSEEADVIFIGEAPGETEAIDGIPFVGQSGKLLAAAVDQAGGDLDTQFRTNVVACRPPNNREPSPQEAMCCRHRLEAELGSVWGKKIMALGNTAQEAFGVAGLQRGAMYQKDLYQIMPAYHPAYVLREPKEAPEFLAQVRHILDPEAKVNPIVWPEVRWAHSPEELDKMLGECADGEWVSFDLETDQVRWYETMTETPDMILMMQIAWDEHFAIIIDDEMLYDTPGTVQVLQNFFDRVSTCGQNFKFDCVFLKVHLGLVVHQDFDIMLADYTLEENLLHGLKAIATREFGIPDYEEETIAPYLRTKGDRYSKVPQDVLAKYGAMDVVIVFKLRPIMEARLLAEGRYYKPFMEILMRAANSLVDVECRGMLVDTAQLDVAHAGFQLKIDTLGETVREMVDEPDLNLGSPQQVSALLFGKLGLPQIKSRKVKAGSTNKEVLEKLIDKHPSIKLIKEWRRVSKMQSSYVDNLLRWSDSKGRVHGNFKIPGTEVSRLAIANPALQTIPRPSDYYGALIRSAFIAAPGKLMVVVDYSQAELRVFAVRSMEPFLLQVYKDGRDLHTEVAVAMYSNEYTKEQRVLCKMFNFSYVYGGTEYSFAQDSGLNIDVARQFVRNYNELMPIGKQYKVDSLKELKEKGYVETIFGRRRHFPLITLANIDEARKAAVHMPCASTASDLTLISAMDAMDLGIPVVLTVHDSVVAECWAERAEADGAKIAEIMKGNGDRYLPEVPWKADVEIGQRWAEPLPMQ